MKIRPLIIGDIERGNLQKLKEYAEANPISMEDLKSTVVGAKPPIGDDARHAVYLPVGYRVVYSVEQQMPGIMRHFSISVPEKGKFPNMHVVNELIGILGFKEKVDPKQPLSNERPREFFVWIEHQQAINILEIM